MTQNIERRMQEHNVGKTKSTKGFCHWDKIYSEEVLDREEARRREKDWKSVSGKEFIRKL